MPIFGERTRGWTREFEELVEAGRDALASGRELHILESGIRGVLGRAGLEVVAHPLADLVASAPPVPPPPSGGRGVLLLSGPASPDWWLALRQLAGERTIGGRRIDAGWIVVVAEEDRSVREEPVAMPLHCMFS